MIRTVVCEREGCTGNIFSIATEDGKLKITCENCHSKYYFDVSENEYIILSNCCKCNGDKFKIYRDTEKNILYMKCSKCGSPPEKIYIDADGIQVSYESKLLNDVKELLNKIDQRVCSLEMQIKEVESGQNILEESLAYINKFIVEKN